MPDRVAAYKSEQKCLRPSHPATEWEVEVPASANLRLAERQREYPMNDGIIEQVGTGDEIYGEPATPFVASFVGETNVFTGRVAEREGELAYVETSLGRLLGANKAGLEVGAEAMLFVRPENLGLADTLGDLPYGNSITVTVERRDLEGAYVNLFLKANGCEMSMHLTNSGAAGRDLSGEQRVGFRREHAVVLPVGPLAKTGKEMVGP